MFNFLSSLVNQSARKVGATTVVVAALFLFTLNIGTSIVSASEEVSSDAVTTTEVVAENIIVPVEAAPVETVATIEEEAPATETETVVEPTPADSDGDGLTNTVEDTIGTDQENADTDADGYTDGTEVANGYNPDGSGELTGTDLESAPVTTTEGVVAGESVVSETPSGETEASTSVPELTTDKADYHPGETATIFGKFFQAVTEYVLKVFSEDFYGNNYTETTINVVTDTLGSFTTSYTLDNIFRPVYNVVANAISGEQVAETTFTDSAIGTYDQCSNDDGDGYAAGDTGCRWINGNLNGNNSTYAEGDATVQRLWLDGFAPGSTHTVTLKYGTTKAGTHAYDYLTNWDWSENWIAVADRCQGITGCTTAVDTILPIPNDPNVTDTIEPTPGPRVFTMRGGTPTSATVPAIVSGTYAGDSETVITLSFTVAPSGSMCATQNNTTSCGVALWFGAHISKTMEWQAHNNTIGAGGINGSPYHVALDQMDGAAVGSRDNQMQSSAIIAASTITIDKVTVPGGDTQSFSYATTGTGYSNFALTDAATPNAQVVAPGSFSVTEGAIAGWDLTGLTCNASGTGTSATTNLANRSVSITIGAGGGGTVNCTYTNTKRGHIIVDKVTNPAGDTQSFNFTAGGTGYTNFALTDAAAANDQVVVPGTYSVAETVPAGWDQSSATCSDGSPINAIAVAAGETVTCTFTNTKRGTVIVKKVMVNGTSTFNYTGTPSGSISTNNGTISSTNLVPGAYASTEGALPAGWVLSSIVCDDANSTGNIGTRTANFSLQAGETVTCTFTNTLQQGHIIVDKVTNPAADPQSFSFTAGGTGYSNFALTDAAQPNDQTLNAGTYSVAESVPAGWDLTSATCSDGSPINNISLQGGEVITCTFTNTKRGHIIVDKVTDPIGDSQSFNFVATGAGYSNFALTDAAAPNNQEVVPGAYAISETVPAGWDLTSATCDMGETPASLDVGPGETVTCTFTNQKDANIIVVKQTLPDGDAQVFNFTASYDGDGYSLSDGQSNDSGDLNPGSYSVSETVPAGWTQTSATCTDGTPANVSLQAGEIVTCTFINTKKAHIIVDKVTNPSGDLQSFNFTATGAGYNNFALTDEAAPNNQEVLPGAYTIFETVPAGWDLTSATCDSAEAPNSIDVGPGETVTCTFTNTKRGHIIVDKVTDPSGDPQSFNFTATGAGYSNFALTDAAAPNNQEVVPGAYAISETVPAGWDLTSATCDQGETPASLDVQPGETVTCTFTNQKDANIIVVKQTDPDGDETLFEFDPSYAGNFSLSDGQSNNSGDLDPGTYSVAENTPAGWDLTSATCTDGTPENLSLQAGETITCTFTNQKDSKIIVIKQTLPDGDAQSFDFTASYDGDGFALIDGGSNDSGDLNPGNYSVSETVPAGWDQTSATCSDESAPATINLAAGETVTCTFTNTKRGHIIVDKVTAPAADPQSFDFTTTGTGFSGFALTDAAAANNQEVVPGAYSVSETTVAGWDLTSATCDQDETPASLDVQPGETVTCTFTNTKRGHIVVDKVTYPSGDSQSFSFTTTGADYSGFALTDVAAPNNQEVVAGAYTVSETTVAGWDLESATCDLGETPASLDVQPGETVTCTFTNIKTPFIEIETSATNEVGDDHTFTVTVGQNGTGGFVPAADGTIVTVTFSPSNPTIDSDSCATGTVAGTCTVVINSAVAGIFTANASTSVTIGGHVYNLTTDGQGENSGSATKTYVDASIALSPLEATNAINDPHTITAHVTKNNGSGVTNAAGVTVTFSVTSGSATFVGNDNNCVTAANGECSIQIISTVVGANTINATTTFSVGGVSLTRATNGDAGPDGTGSASKTYVNARISINPPQATNQVDESHDFTVTVEQDTGSGFAPVANAVVNVDVLPAPNGGLDETDCTDGTNVSGQCVATINSSVAGVFTATASSTIEVGGVEFNLTTDGNNGNSDTAEKTYVDAKISVDPQQATNNVNEPHTITATVTEDSGTGSVPAAGELITFTLVNNTAGAAFVGGINTCVTNVSGQCSVDINTSTPGNVDTHAAVDVTVSTEVVHRETDGTHGSSDDATKTYVGGIIIIQKVTVGGDASFEFDVDYKANFNLMNGQNNNSGYIAVGTHSAAEVNIPAGWQQTAASCSDGSPVGAISLQNGETVTCTFTNTKLGSLKITKDAQPNDLIDFTFNTTNLNPATFKLDDDAGVADAGLNGDINQPQFRTYNSLLPGVYGVTEVQPNTFWVLQSLTCVYAGTTNAYPGAVKNGNTVTVTLAAGDNVECTYVNIKPSPTRTIGFWQTHTTYTSSVFAAKFAGGMQIGSGIHRGLITNVQGAGQSQLFGAFYSAIPKTTTGAKRTDVDKARMQLLQQLVGAKLNCANFGCAATIQAQVANADTVYATGTVAQILAAASQMDAFNNSGDTMTIGPAGSASPKTSTSWANKLFWDLP